VVETEMLLLLAFQQEGRVLDGTFALFAGNLLTLLKS